MLFYQNGEKQNKEDKIALVVTPALGVDRDLCSFVFFRSPGVKGQHVGLENAVVLAEGWQDIQLFTDKALKQDFKKLTLTEPWIFETHQTKKNRTNTDKI